MTTTQAFPSLQGHEAVPPTPSRSSPSLTPTSFPLIWDQILRYVDSSTFPSLRATCTDLYYDINSILYNHVEVHLTKQGDRLIIDLCAPYTHRRIPGLNFATDPESCLETLHECCMQLDEVVHGVPVLKGVRDADLSTFRALERALENVTEHRSNAEHFFSMFSLPQVRKVVAFLHPKPDPYAGYDSEEDDAFPDPSAVHLFLTTPGPSVRYVIINLTVGATGFRADNLKDMANLEQMVIIVRKGDAPPPAPLRMCAGLSGLMYSIAPLFPRLSIIVFGLEALPDNWVSFKPVPADAAERRHHLRTEIALWIRCCHVLRAGQAAEWEASLANGAGDDVIGLSAIMDSVAVESLDTMREKIGEGQFGWYTSPPAAWAVQVDAGNGRGQ